MIDAVRGCEQCLNNLFSTKAEGRFLFCTFPIPAPLPVIPEEAEVEERKILFVKDELKLKGILLFVVDS